VLGERASSRRRFPNLHAAHRRRLVASSGDPDLGELTATNQQPVDFGVNDDIHFVCTLPTAAPEIFQHEGKYYMTALLPSLKGIRIARLEWVAAK